MKTNTFAILITLFLTFQTFAVQYFFKVNEGNWNVPGNWNESVVPTSADQPIIPAGRTVIINSDVGQCNVIFCGQSISNPRWGKIQMRPGGKLSAPILILGRDEDNHGIFSLCGGELSLSTYLSVGDNGDNPNSARGSLFLSAGSLKMLGNATSYIGNKGYGYMLVSGNGTFYANDIIVANNSGSESSEINIIGGKVFANNITLGSTSTSAGSLKISGGSLVWSNQCYVRDVFRVCNGSPSINGVLSGGTALYFDQFSSLEFDIGADGIAPVMIENSKIHITSGAILHINGSYYTRGGDGAKSFLLVKHNGYDGSQTTFSTVTYDGLGGLIPSIRYESDAIYLDLTNGSEETARSAQGIFMKYWQVPIDDDGDASVIPAPLFAMPLFTDTVVRVHPIFGKRVSKMDLSEILRDDNILLQFEGYIDIPSAGTYTFYLNSDDGSKMWIDNSLLVDNDGSHAVVEVSASTTLTKGMHKIEVGYFNNTGKKVFNVNWSGPGISKQEIPENVLYVSEFKNAFSELIAFHNIMPDEERTYNYCPSFLYDEVEGLYKIWSGGAGGGDNILYKESPTLDGLLDCPTKSVLQPSHDHSKFDDLHTCDPNVFCVSGTFYLSYSGNTDNSDLYEATRIGMSVSYDRGRTWTRLHGGKAILAPSPDYTSDPNNYGIGQSAVVQADDGYFYMIYTDVNQFRSGQKSFLRVIRCSDPTFPTNKHEMVNPDVPNTDGHSLDLAYDKNSKEFIVITDVSDDPDVVEDPYAKVQLAYYDKNWNYLRKYIIQVHTLWSFGEGVALLTNLKKEPLQYSYYGEPSLVTAAATCEYNDDAGGLWAEWVGGDTKYLITSLAFSETTYFTGGDLRNTINWTGGLPAGRVAIINNNGYYNGVAQNTPWISGSMVTVGVGAVLGPLQADLSVYGGTLIVNDATINCVDDFFCDGGNVVLNEGSVTTCNDDWEANDHAGRITVNGGTHSSGPDSGMYVGAQGGSARIGCGIDFRGGTVIAGDFRFQLNSSSSIGGGAVLTSASPTTAITDYSGNINFISGWTGYWEVGSFSPGNWKTVLTSGGNITLDGTPIDADIFATYFIVSDDGTTLIGAIPECSLFMVFLTIAGLFIRRYYN